MDEKDIDTFAEAFKVALKNLTAKPEETTKKEEAPQETQKQEAPKQEQAKPEPEPQAQKQEEVKQEHVVTSPKDILDYKIPRPRTVKDVMDELNDIYHPTTHDFLACNICRPMFEDEVKAMGYDVQDKNGIITITPKKAPKK
jgi:hypothetical protein